MNVSDSSVKDMRREDDLISIGTVARPHGIRGGIKVIPEMRWPESFMKNGHFFLSGKETSSRRVQIDHIQCAGSSYILYLKGFESREDAEALRGEKIQIPRKAFPALGKDEYYFFELFGIKVETAGGREVGVVQDVFHHEGHDVYVVWNGNKEVLIPAVKEIIRRIDISGRRMLIEPIEGLLD